MFNLFDFEYRFGRTVDALVSDDRSVIVVGVSGGVDSMVMLWLLLKRMPLDRLVVAHCNFGLRGEEADAESRMVEEFCAERDVRFEMARFDTYAVCRERGEGVQVVARELRYDFFGQLILKYSADHVAIAHNRDDATETFFINLIRGTGLRGLLSIAECRDRVVRPLMFASREEILSYSKAEAVPYRDDSSNADTHYLRNKLRHNVLPSLREISGGFDQMMSENIERLGRSYSFEQQIIEKVRSRVVSGDRISVEAFMSEDGASVYLLYRLLGDWGFSWDSCQRIYGDITEGRGQGNFYYGRECRALIDRGWVVLQRDGEYSKEGVITESDVEILDPKSLDSFRATADSCYFDLSGLKFPLTVRRWNTGDRIRPYGMKGRSKLVSDLLINAKVSRFEKESQRVVVNGDGEILWVVGIRSSQSCAISEETTAVARVSL